MTIDKFCYLCHDNKMSINILNVKDHPFPTELEVSDRFLVGVEVVSRHGGTYIDWQVIVVNEDDFDTPDGESWGAWSVEDIGWWCKLPTLGQVTHSA